MYTSKFVETFPETKVYFDRSLSAFTYTQTGGPAELLIFPKSKLEAASILEWLKEQEIPVTILGNASNVIIRDGGIRGAVIMLNEMTDIHVEKNRIFVDGGVALIHTSQVARDHHLTGLEFACGIPGSVGGAVYMNAGAYGGEVEEVIEYVEVITPEGEFKRYYRSDLDFSYRHSRIQESGDLVIEVCFNLRFGNIDDIQSRMDELTQLRVSKQPLEYPSCGSVFKRPEGYFTGKLIQDAGIQGKQIGGAQISMKHAGFIVNIDKASATDYLDLIAFIQKTIFDLYGVRLEPEVRIIGEEI